jgi:hypothetical protein
VVRYPPAVWQIHRCLGQGALAAVVWGKVVCSCCGMQLVCMLSCHYVVHCTAEGCAEWQP